MPYADPNKQMQYMKDYSRKVKCNMPSPKKAVEQNLSDEKLQEYFTAYMNKIKELRAGL